MFLPPDFKNVPKLLRDLKTKPEEYWIKRGERRVLKLFHQMAERVPAYKNFLKKNGVKPQKIKGFKQLQSVPTTSKDNYLTKYPTEQLCWDGQFSNKQWVVSSTSGSTGKPYYFPRSRVQDDQFASTAELLFRDYFNIDKQSTLFVDCFALGVWIGGMYMYQALKQLADSKKFALTIITPGAYKEEAIKAIAELGNKFDQVIIGGYAPLVKDLLDDGVQYGLKWNQYNIKFFFAAEGFSEQFRDYILKKCGIKNPYLSSFNHYGTADLGTMAHETPISILLRRLTAQKPSLYKEIFLEANKMPTLTQFIPELFFFEENQGNLLCSSNSGLPLVRYDLKDRGRVFTYAQATQWCLKNGVDLKEKARKLKLFKYSWSLPFVYVFERGDLTVSIYSVNIYPECIRRALEVKEFERLITGKFSMLVQYDKRQNQYLEINIEMKQGIHESSKLKVTVLNSIIRYLIEENSEWRDFYADPGIRHKVVPKLSFWKYQDPAHFKPGIKQKWVKKHKI